MHRTVPAVWFQLVERRAVPARPVIGTTLNVCIGPNRDIIF
jgi:hypothetical protein